MQNGWMLKFMATNGLVADPSKTEFMILNRKEKGKEWSIEFGESVIPQSIKELPWMIIRSERATELWQNQTERQETK